MSRQKLVFACFILALVCGSASGQVLKGSTTQRQLNQSATAVNSVSQSNKLIQSALAHSVQVTSTAMPGGMAVGSTRTIIAVLRRQSAAAHSLLLPAVRPVATNSGGTLLNGGANQMLNPQPMPPKGSAPQIGVGHTMNSPGSGSSGISNANTVPPTMQQASSSVAQGHPQQPQKFGAQVIPTQVCMPGIATVDGQKSGVWFSPVSGPDGQFVIQGCGFGSMPGEVYLTGVQYDPTRSKAIVHPIGLSTSPDQVNFTIPSNQWNGNRKFATSWSDRLIVAQIDPNASGLYDTNNVTLVVRTASGHLYQVAGMNFVAARADQLLSWIVPPPAGYSSYVMNTASVSNPTAVIHLATVTDSSGNALLPTVSSPAAGTIWSAETVGAIRAKLAQSTPSKTTFPGGTDTYQLNLASGFQLDPQTGVQMRHTQIDVAQCQQSFNGDYVSNGNWGINYTSKTAFQILWQEQSCWPKAGTQGLSPLDYGSVSVYALQVTVLGPRGVSPWAGGNQNPLTIKQGAQHPLLLGH